MKILAFVFARGGSKRLPGKNLLRLEDKSLVQHSIDFAASLSYVSSVWVSTDSSEISSIATSLGANVIERPPSLAADDSNEFLAWKHAVNFVRKNHGEFDGFLSLPATSPLRSREDIDNLVQGLGAEDDLAVCVAPSRVKPDFNLVEMDDSCRVRPYSKKAPIVYRHQDSAEIYELTTVGYFCRPSFITREDSIWGGKIAGVKVPRERAIDIDDELDFELARWLMHKKQKGEN